MPARAEPPAGKPAGSPEAAAAAVQALVQAEVLVAPAAPEVEADADAALDADEAHDGASRSAVVAASRQLVPAACFASDSDDAVARRGSACAGRGSDWRRVEAAD